MMRSRIAFLFLSTLFLSFLWVHASEARVYKWKDENGKLHFTDSASKIPPKYRKNFKAEPKKYEKKTTNRASQQFMETFKKEWAKWPNVSSRAPQGSVRYKIVGDNRSRYEPVKFRRFQFVEWKGRRDHENFFPIAGMPTSGMEQVAEATVFSADSAVFRLVTPSGQEIQKLDLRRGPGRYSSPRYLGAVMPPDQPFQVAVSGVDVKGVPYNLTYPTVFQTKTIVFEKVMRSGLFLFQGKNLIIANVTNYGKKGTFIIKATDENGYVTKVEPTSMRLDQGETGKLQVDLWIPADTPEYSNFEVTLVVTSDINPNITNTTVQSGSIMIRPTLTVPPDITVAATGRYTQVDIGQATATDNKGIHSIKNDAPAKGFPVGSTKVTWRAMDTGGKTTTGVPNHHRYTSIRKEQ